jgi:hypothetical protein
MTVRSWLVLSWLMSEILSLIYLLFCYGNIKADLESQREMVQVAWWRGTPTASQIVVMLNRHRVLFPSSRTRLALIALLCWLVGSFAIMFIASSIPHS